MSEPRVSDFDLEQEIIDIGDSRTKHDPYYATLLDLRDARARIQELEKRLALFTAAQETIAGTVRSLPDDTVVVGRQALEELHAIADRAEAAESSLAKSRDREAALREALENCEKFIRNEYAYGGSEALFRGSAYPPDVEKLKMWDALASTESAATEWRQTVEAAERERCLDLVINEMRSAGFRKNVSPEYWDALENGMRGAAEGPTKET